METIGEMISELFKLISEILSAIWEVLPRAISFFLWILVAIVVLPCLFISGVIYPKWVEWGENL
jgi:hypothetical protein